MKKLSTMIALMLICVVTVAQDNTYFMKIHYSDGTTESHDIADIDSISFSIFGAVDLGLSVKWATCNIGAEFPEDYGNYYAWGETETKKYYNELTSVTFGLTIDDIAGNAEYDAAVANLGGSWRMPTYDEMKELISNCTWVWGTMNGVNGCLVTGVNGNSIFLPAGGYSTGSYWQKGERGCYWTSTPPIDNNDAWFLDFGNDGPTMSGYYRFYGHLIRPVME